MTVSGLNLGATFVIFAIFSFFSNVIVSCEAML